MNMNKNIGTRNNILLVKSTYNGPPAQLIPLSNLKAQSNNDLLHSARSDSTYLILELPVPSDFKAWYGSLAPPFKTFLGVVSFVRWWRRYLLPYIRHTPSLLFSTQIASQSCMSSLHDYSGRTTASFIILFARNLPLLYWARQRLPKKTGPVTSIDPTERWWELIYFLLISKTFLLQLQKS